MKLSTSNFFFCALICLIHISCCNSSKVTITTPSQDVEYCNNLLDSCSSLKELDNARSIINQYKAAYSKAMYEGNITAPQYNEFLLHCPNEAEIQNVAVYVAHFGKSIKAN